MTPSKLIVVVEIVEVKLMSQCCSSMLLMKLRK